MKCSTEKCRNQRAHSRTVCYKCKKKRYIDKDPIRYCYQTLKDNAKRRGKYFDLPLNWFRKWATKYLMTHARGRTRDSFSVDRDKNHLGYTKTNIRPSTVGENSSKGTKKITYDYRTKTGGVAVSTPRPQENYPF